MHFSLDNLKRIRFLKHLNQCRYINSNPVPLSCIEIKRHDINPEKTPLIAFHGLFGGKNNLKSLMNQICSQTNTIGYCCDLRNHGESPHVDGQQSGIDAMAYDVKYFMDCRKIDKADLFGHSLGGRVVAQFSFYWPERVNKLIMADISPLPTLPRIEFMAGDFFDTLGNCVRDLPADINLTQARSLIKNVLNPVIKNTLIVDFLLLNLYDDNGIIKWRWNLDALKTLVQGRMISQMEVAKPFMGNTLIVFGEQSEYVRPKDFDQIKTIMPKVKFVSIPDTGHYLHVEKPHRFIEIVVEFLNEQ